jgi:hypothetical protein
VTDQPPLTDAQISRAWGEISIRANELVARRQAALLWPVEHGSQLAGDNTRSNPWRTSDIASAAMGTALDHLHALTTLAVDGAALHAYAPFTLARGCLENAAVALWIVNPKQRNDRIIRALTWYHTEIQDFSRASEGTGVDMSKILAAQIQQLRQTAARCGCDASLLTRPVNSTDVLRYADSVMRHQGVQPLFVWRLCSAFAHGRHWPALVGLVELEQRAADDLNIHSSRRIGSFERLLHPALVGLGVLDLAIRTYERRAATTPKRTVQR